MTTEHRRREYRASPTFPAAPGESSRSNDGNEGECVEVAKLPGRVVMRDSKDPTGPVLAFTNTEWSAFLSGIRVADFD